MSIKAVKKFFSDNLNQHTYLMISKNGVAKRERFLRGISRRGNTCLREASVEIIYKSRCSITSRKINYVLEKYAERMAL